MFTYPKQLRRKDLKKISKHPCDSKIKEAYTKYLTNYSFEEFVDYCEDNNEKNLKDLIFKFTDLQLEKFQPNSLIWISHVLVNFLIYFNVNLDYGDYYDAYATSLQLTVLSISLKMTIDKITFDEVTLPAHSVDCFREFFSRCPDFNYNLEKDCQLAYKSFNQDFNFTSEDFYLKINEHFENEGYLN
ncbi:hypothetical protein [Methanobrevibacter sp.]|uniref:hypothetical protein n=1 Tax=Methanobrevibacter sp. TaxID=66852 RepID=UPI00388DBE71